VTPLGAGPKAVWAAIRAGQRVTPVDIIHPENGHRYTGAPVPAPFTAALAREARLRRSSAISLLAATAAKQAVESSGMRWGQGAGERTAIVFGVSSGGVQYTRRFYEQVVKQGANVASPMLFPETVYNAPASHVAAMLGIDGATYTLVGDGTIGLQALAFGTQLLHLGNAEKVIVVAAEELDWILLEAHRHWRLTAEGRRPGALLAEGAAAVVLSADGGPVQARVTRGHSFVSRREARAAISAAIGECATAGAIDLVVSGGNDTWADALIHEAAAAFFPPSENHFVSPKRHVGEALGAGALLQVVLAMEALAEDGFQRALVASLGWNQQAAAALVERIA
jgi:hypothetical protein